VATIHESRFSTFYVALMAAVSALAAAAGLALTGERPAELSGALEPALLVVAAVLLLLAGALAGRSVGAARAPAAAGLLVVAVVLLLTLRDGGSSAAFLEVLSVLLGVALLAQLRRQP